MLESTMNYPTPPTGSLTGEGRNTSNWEVLRTAFAESLRLTLTNQTSGVADTGQKNGAEKRQEQQSHREQEQQRNLQTDRRDFTKEDKRTLNKSEIRHSTIDDDYVRKLDRQDHLQTEYRERVDHRTNLPQTLTALSEPLSETPFTSSLTPPQATLTSPMPLSVSSATPQSSVIVPVSVRVANSQPLPMIVAESLLPAAVTPLMSIGTVSSTAMPTPLDALTAASVMTIFTATGRFGQLKSESEERSTTEKKKEKKSAVAVSLFGQTEMPENTENKSVENTETEPESSAEQDFSVRKSVKEADNETAEDAPTGGISLKDMLKDIAKKPSEEEPDEAVLELLRRMGEQFVPKPEPKEAVSKPFDRFLFIQRVTAACQSAANQNGTVRFKLNLDQLGSLTLKITSKANRLSIRFEAATETAARKILDNIAELKSALAEQNIALDLVDVNVL